MIDNTSLTGQQCTACQRGSLLAGPYCPFGCGRTLVAAELPNTGEVYASTVVHVPAGQLPVPHQVGYVDLPHDVRVFGHFDATQPVPPSTPVRVVKVDVDAAAAIPYVRYRFELREEDAA